MVIELDRGRSVCDFRGGGVTNKSLTDFRDIRLIGHLLRGWCQTPQVFVNFNKARITQTCLKVILALLKSSACKARSHTRNKEQLRGEHPAAARVGQFSPSLALTLARLLIQLSLKTLNYGKEKDDH